MTDKNTKKIIMVGKNNMRVRYNQKRLKKKIINLLVVIFLITTILSPIIINIIAQPINPTDFTATTQDRFTIILTWVNDGLNNTYINRWS